jgi:sporulation-control protein
MSLFSRVGIGAATVDLVLDTTAVAPGGKIGAHVAVTGGRAEQTVDAVQVALLTHYRTRSGGSRDTAWVPYALWTRTLTDGFTIAAEVEETFDVPPLEIPATTPVSMGYAKVWLQTGLDIDWSLDPQDQDILKVIPGDRLQALLDAAEQLQLDLRTVETLETPAAFGPHPFVQTFVHRATDGPYADALRTVELSAVPGAGGLRVGVERDRRDAPPLTGASTAAFTLSEADVDAATTALRAAIEQAAG